MGPLARAKKQSGAQPRGGVCNPVKLAPLFFLPGPKGPWALGPGPWPLVVYYYIITRLFYIILYILYIILYKS